jgi:hypothetical protein
MQGRNTLLNLNNAFFDVNKKRKRSARRDTGSRSVAETWLTRRAIFPLFDQNNSALAAPTQAKKSQLMPGHLKLKSPFNKLFDFFHLAILKIFRFAAIPADQVMMVFTIVIRKLVATSLRHVVNFRQHPQPTEQLNSAINRGQIDVAIRQLRVHSGWSQWPLVFEKHLQHEAPRLRLAKTSLDHSPLNDVRDPFHLFSITPDE